MNKIQLVKAFSKKEHAYCFQKGHIILRQYECNSGSVEERTCKIKETIFCDNFFSLYMYDQNELSHSKQAESFIVAINDHRALLHQIVSKVKEANLIIRDSTESILSTQKLPNVYYRVVMSQEKACIEHHLGISLELCNQFEKSTDDLEWQFYNKVKDDQYHNIEKPLLIESPNHQELHEELLKQNPRCCAELHLYNINFKSSLI